MTIRRTCENSTDALQSSRPRRYIRHWVSQAQRYTTGADRDAVIATSHTTTLGRLRRASEGLIKSLRKRSFDWDSASSTAARRRTITPAADWLRLPLTTLHQASVFPSQRCRKAFHSLSDRRHGPATTLAISRHSRGMVFRVLQD